MILQAKRKLNLNKHNYLILALLVTELYFWMEKVGPTSSISKIFPIPNELHKLSVKLFGLFYGTNI